MLFHKVSRILLLAPLLLIAECDAEQEAKTDEVVRPVKSVLVGENAEGTVREFPARILANDRGHNSMKHNATFTSTSVEVGRNMVHSIQIMVAYS